MATRKPIYLWQRPGWPVLSFDAEAVAPDLRDARLAQGELQGKAQAIGLVQTGELARETFAEEVIATAAIEGERLDPASVRSSVLRRLGLADEAPRDRHVDGLVQVIADATQGFDRPLDDDRLQRWQSALFPGGNSGIRRIAVGRYRDHADPMQTVSGMPGREIVHFEPPPSARVAAEMREFLAWFSRTAPAGGRAGELDGLARAAVAHLWFETIHPFEDGNSRIGRAIVDLAVMQDQPTPLRLHGLSQQLLASRAGYHDALNRAQRGDVDVTAWVRWFAGQFAAACRRAGQVIDRALEKRHFWADHAGAALNARQRKVLQRLLDDGDGGGFIGGLNAEKYMKMTGASKATATRDLAALRGADLLWTTGAGKAMRYHVNVPGWRHGTAAVTEP